MPDPSYYYYSLSDIVCDSPSLSHLLTGGGVGVSPHILNTVTLYYFILLIIRCADEKRTTKRPSPIHRQVS
jgi:hypothetical protein